MDKKIVMPKCPICNAQYKEAGVTEYRDSETGKMVAPKARTITVDHAEDCRLGNLRK